MAADSWWIYCVYTQIYSSKTTWPKNWPKPLRPREMAKSLRQHRSRPTSSFRSKGQSLQKWENHRKLGQNCLYYRYYAPIDDYHGNWWSSLGNWENLISSQNQFITKDDRAYFIERWCLKPWLRDSPKQMGYHGGLKGCTLGHNQHFGMYGKWCLHPWDGRTFTAEASARMQAWGLAMIVVMECALSTFIHLKFEMWFK